MLRKAVKGEGVLATRRLAHGTAARRERCTQHDAKSRVAAPGAWDEAAAVVHMYDGSTL